MIYLKIIQKGVCGLFVFLLLFTAVPLQTLASNTGTIAIMPLWANTSDISLSLSFSSGTAMCSGLIIGKPGTTKINATFYLQIKNMNGTFSTVKTWSGLTSNNVFLTFSGTNSVTSGQTYRLRCDAIITRNGSTETVSVFSGERRA